MRLILFLLLCLCSSQASALVLENLISANSLQATFTDKRIGYYIGSFDPLHKGHEEIAILPVKQGLCDYVIIYPAWGGDNYKKRVDVKLRHDMVYSVFANHPSVIVTQLPPQDLQNALIKGYTENVKPAFKGMEFIGIIGSDTALALYEHSEALSTFMTGIKVTDQYKEHTLGGIMALPANLFIVALREGDDISKLNSKIGNRPVIALIESEKERALSSTKVKKLLKEGQDISHMVSRAVKKIIEKNLYN
jgi:nicotinic acid mononucleotide adenylyltransferase